MSYADAHKALELRMQSNWTATQVGYEDVDFNPVQDKLTEWVEFWVVEGSAVNDSVKQKWLRHAGVVQCDIYVSKTKSNTSRRQRELMDLFLALFANVDIPADGIRLRAPIPINGAPSVDGFSRKTIQIQFTREEAD